MRMKRSDYGLLDLRLTVDSKQWLLVNLLNLVKSHTHTHTPWNSSVLIYKSAAIKYKAPYGSNTLKVVSKNTFVKKNTLTL